MNPTRSGSYIQLTKKGGAKPNQEQVFTIPYSGPIGLSVAQETRQPVKEFFKELGDAIISLEDTASSGLAVATSFVRDFQDITGVKFFTRGYYSTAWVGEEPATFSTKLEFFRGWMGYWNAQVEVFTPIMQIMNQTVPNDNNIIGGVGISAPMTNGIEAFGNFSAGVVTGIGSLFTSLGSSILGAIGNGLSGSDFTNAAKTQLDSATDTLKKSTLTTNNTWTVSFGWCSGDTTTFIPFYSMNQLIVTSSSFNFSSSLERDSRDTGYGFSTSKYYPISGTVDLTFKAQNLLTSSQFGQYIGS
jgi:hypothetical protein